jgi:hypothetical protein
MKVEIERCWIPRRRPLRKMDALVRKVEGAPDIECPGGIWRDAPLRELADPGDILYNELNEGRRRGYHLTEDQFRNVRHLVGDSGARPADSAYKSHRRGYVFSDTEKEAAAAVKERCRHPKVCAFTIRGSAKSEETRTATFDLGDPEEAFRPFRLKCSGQGSVTRLAFETLEDLRESLERLGASGECLWGAEVEKVEYALSVESEIEVDETWFDEVRYLTLRE